MHHANGDKDWSVGEDRRGEAAFEHGHGSAALPPLVLFQAG